MAPRASRKRAEEAARLEGDRFKSESTGQSPFHDELLCRRFRDVEAVGEVANHQRPPPLRAREPRAVVPGLLEEPDRLQRVVRISLERPDSTPLASREGQESTVGDLSMG